MQPQAIIRCKICEKNTLCDRLVDHSRKCKEVNDLHGNLSSFRSIMEKYAEKAALMRNSLETYAVKQKNKFKKKLSRCNSTGDIPVPLKTSIFKDYSCYNSPASCGLKPKKAIFSSEDKSSNETSVDESPKSQEIEEIQHQITDNQNKEIKQESPEKLSEEDYEKFKDQVRKSTFALKRIIAYADKINEWSFEAISMNDLDLNFKHELEILYSEIDDTKVSEFLKGFMNDFCTYLACKARYIRKKEELCKIDSQENQYNNIQANKTLIFKQRTFTGLKTRSHEQKDKESASTFKAGRSEWSKRNMRESIMNSLKIVTNGLIPRNLDENFENEGFEWSEKTPEFEACTILGNSPPSIELKTAKSINTDSTGNFIEVGVNQTAVGSNQSIKDELNQEKIKKDIITLFRELHKEETLSRLSFPSLLRPENDLERHSANVALTTPRKSPGKSHWHSPLMRGYHSDTNHRPKRKRSEWEPSLVTIKDFEFVKFLGKGAYGTVWLVRKRATGDQYAMKIVNWADRAVHNRLAALKAEKDIYEVLQGDFVVKAIWTFHYDNFICFVTEYMIGGDFNTFLEDAGRLDEDQARFYVGELVLAIESLHSLGIIHRDLKPDNILIDNKGHIRLTDFGLSKRGLNDLNDLMHNATPIQPKSSSLSLNPINQQTLSQRRTQMPTELYQTLELDQECNQKVKFYVKPTEKIFKCLDDDNENHHPLPRMRADKTMSPLKARPNARAAVGTPDYMAPEVVNPENFDGEIYDERALDWWSLGVILYQFLVGIPPFCGETVSEVFSNIANLRLEWPEIGYEEDCISPEAADLIKCLLDPNPSKRLGARGIEEIKNHTFFQVKGFKWREPKNWEPPIIPYLPEEPETQQLEQSRSASEEKDGLHSIFIEPLPKKIAKLRPENLRGFHMRRLDVLDKLNQEAFLDHQKQKGATLTNV